MNIDNKVLFLLMPGNSKSELTEPPAQPDSPDSHNGDPVANAERPVKRLTAPYASRTAGCVAVNCCYKDSFDHRYFLAATDLTTNSIMAVAIAVSFDDGLDRVMEELSSVGINCRPRQVHFGEDFSLSDKMLKRCAEVGIDIVLNSAQSGSTLALFECAAMWLQREFKRARKTAATEAQFLAGVENAIRQVNAWPKRGQKIPA